MISTDQCLQYAAAYEELAKEAGAEDREQLLRLATEWRQMAERQAQAQADTQRSATRH